MVAIVSGNSLGLSLTSLTALGDRFDPGMAANGRAGEHAYVNIASGNLVLRDDDEHLAGRGIDIDAVRVYNSQGKFNDDNGDNWALGSYRREAVLTPGVNGSPGAIVRTGRDGAESTYAWNAAKNCYLSSDGDGAHDSFVVHSDRLVWTDGTSGLIEVYEVCEAGAPGRLLSTSDAAGNTVRYAYHASGLLASAESAGGDSMFFDYSDNNLTRIRTVSAAGVTQTRARYAYDASNRLSSVSVDLSPADNAIADEHIYTTRYEYDGSSKRIAAIAQDDGTRLAFGYVLAGGAYRVASVTDALGRVTSYAYDTGNRRTTVTDP